MSPDPHHTSMTPSSTIGRADLTAGVLGVVAGFLSGMFGVGGGILIVPALVMVLRMEQRLAHGTSLAAIVPIAVAGVVGYSLDGSVDWVAAACLIAGSATLGAVLGTHLLQILPRRGLAIAFAFTLLATAARMLFETTDAVGRPDLTWTMLAGLLVLGIASGVLAGLLGVGGGIVMVPAMIVLFGIPAVIAKGTSLVVIIPTALVGTRRNLAKENADLRVAIIVGLTGVVSAFGASQISIGLDEQLSNRLFAALLAVVAIKMVIDEIRRPRHAAKDH